MSIENNYYKKWNHKSKLYNFNIIYLKKKHVSKIKN